jgi:predicted nucleotidyltransferase
MNPELAQIFTDQAAAIVEACRRHRVLKLELIGSASGADFDPQRSDIDLVVTFLPDAMAKAFDHFFGLKEALELLFNRPVDLMTGPSVRNPYLASEIRKTGQIIYAASVTETVE